MVVFHTHAVASSSLRVPALFIASAHYFRRCHAGNRVTPHVLYTILPLHFVTYKTLNTIIRLEIIVSACAIETGDVGASNPIAFGARSARDLLSIGTSTTLLRFAVTVRRIFRGVSVIVLLLTTTDVTATLRVCANSCITVTWCLILGSVYRTASDRHALRTKLSIILAVVVRRTREGGCATIRVKAGLQSAHGVAGVLVDRHACVGALSGATVRERVSAIRRRSIRAH